MKVFRQSLVLLLLMLVSLPSMSLSMHFCGGELRRLSFLSIGHACDMEEQQEVLPCHQTKKQEQTKSCCQDQPVVSEDHDLINYLSSLKIAKPDLKFITTVFSVVFKLLVGLQFSLPDYHNYSPPLIERDIYMLVQSFLL